MAHLASRATASIWHLTTAVIGIAAMVTQLVMTIRGIDVLIVNGQIAPVGTRIVRFFSYFTIQSNILVALAALTLAWNPRRDGRLWRLLRLDALFGITITGIIYASLIEPITNSKGISRVTDIAVHYVVPVMAVLNHLGYQIVLRNAVGVCVLLLGVAALFMYIDGALPLGRDPVNVNKAVAPASTTSARAATMDT